MKLASKFSDIYTYARISDADLHRSVYCPDKFFSDCAMDVFA